MKIRELLMELEDALARYGADALCARLLNTLPAAQERLRRVLGEMTLEDLEGRDDLLRARLVRLLRAGLCALWLAGEHRVVFTLEHELRRSDTAWVAGWHERLKAGEVGGGEGLAFARWCEGQLWMVKW